MAGWRLEPCEVNMTAKDYLPDGGLRDASYTVKAIVFLLWSPVFVVLNAVAIALVLISIGVGYHVYQTGQIPGWVLEVGAGFSGDWIAIGIAVAPFAALYLVLSNYTFGTSNVESGFDQATDLKDELDGGSNDE